MGLLKKLKERRPPVPESAARHLDRDERALAWAQATTGQVVVATPQGLHVVGTDGHRLIGWHEISKGVWKDGLLSITESEPIDDHQIVDRAPWSLAFDEPGNVPVILRQRVERSIVTTRYYRLSNGAVWLIGRKIPGRDGLVWQYRAERGLDVSDATTKAEILDALRIEDEASRPADL
ncbi:hypothetical protein CLV47_1282 [Antricoccus suffuscus]|uniref:Uncharacterized protein n=1 Tax=Antricoccus suffuscus TaxID=1629062 RepID=A0A2T0Z5D3_9ACTN|nr:hypothetical protein [Antricoccus suffuscus]PRZ31364.1 hypothetical protein CLV47_1282 [Antricoccus suffuscus]